MNALNADAVTTLQVLDNPTLHELVLALGATVVAGCAAWVFARITFRWYVVVGPGPLMDDNWVNRLLPRGEWFTTWEDGGDDLLIIHYTLEKI